MVAGAVDRVDAGRLDFTYARSYLENEKAISLYTPELPPRRGAQEPLDGLAVAACLKDSTPDSWGERVNGDRLGSGDTELGIETYMLESGSNRLAPSTSRKALSTTTREWTRPASTSCTTPPKRSLPANR